MVEGGEAVPEPSSLKSIMSDPENRSGVAVLVNVQVAMAQAVRVNITLPEDALREIERYAQAHGLTRSGFLASAARKVMKESA